MQMLLDLAGVARQGRGAGPAYYGQPLLMEPTRAATAASATAVAPKKRAAALERPLGRYVPGVALLLLVVLGVVGVHATPAPLSHSIGLTLSGNALVAAAVA